MEDEIPLIEKSATKRGGGGESNRTKQRNNTFPPEYLHQHEVKGDDSLQVRRDWKHATAIFRRYLIF